MSLWESDIDHDVVDIHYNNINMIYKYHRQSHHELNDILLFIFQFKIICNFLDELTIVCCQYSESIDQSPKKKYLSLFLLCEWPTAIWKLLSEWNLLLSCQILRKYMFKMCLIFLRFVFLKKSTADHIWCSKCDWPVGIWG